MAGPVVTHITRKVMPDGGMTIFLQPGDLAALCQLVVQRALNAPAGE